MPTFKDVAADIDRRIAKSNVGAPIIHPDEITVRFSRWTQIGWVAYQKGQCAGFLTAQAHELIGRGRAEAIDPETGEVLHIAVKMPEPKTESGQPMPTHWGLNFR